MPRLKDRFMEQVTGIGGVFFKARDPGRMAAWYREHLGIRAEDGHADFAWREKDRPEEIGRTVWSIFPADTDYFGPSRSPFMIIWFQKVRQMSSPVISATGPERFFPTRPGEVPIHPMPALAEVAG